MRFHRGPYNSPGSFTGKSLLKHGLPLLLIFLLAGVAYGQQDSSLDLASLVNAAQQAQAANNYTAAAGYYQDAIKLRPDIPELRANLGLMQHEAGDYPKAILSFQQALHQKPALYVPNLFLGIDYLRTGKVKEALPLLLKAKAMKADDPLPSLTLGKAYSSLGDYSQAIGELRHATRLDPAQSSAWFTLGISYLRQIEADSRSMTGEYTDTAYAKALFAEALVKQSRYKQASDLYKSVLAEDDRPPCMQSEAGFISLAQGDMQGTALAFKTERETHPECSLALLGEARQLIEADANDNSLRLLQQVWQRDHGFFTTNAAVVFAGMSPGRANAFLDFLAQKQTSAPLEQDFYTALSQAIRGEAAAGTRDGDIVSAGSTSENAANKSYSTGEYGRCSSQARASLKSGSEDTLRLLAACSFFTGEYALAADAGRALRALPSHPAAAGLYWSIKAEEKLALTSLARFQQLEPDSARSHILMGDIYRQRTRYDDAQKEYSKALDMSPDDAAALLGLASAYLDNAKTDQAIATAQKALALNPDSPEVNAIMGEAWIAQHKFSDAEPFLLKALKAKPQMLPHIHALLGRIYNAEGKTPEAVRELKLGAGSDDDGSIHYLLARLYEKSGDKTAANDAIAQMKVTQERRRQSAVTAFEDSHSSSLDDAP